MSHYPPSLLNLVDQFAKFPGIGKKTAERLALHVLRADRREAELLAGSILELKNRVRLCSRCFTLSEKEVCEICSNPSRNNAILCVVEKPADMASIERSGAFKGRYHILQGVLSPMDNIGPDEIRISELFRRIHEDKIKEVILATGTNVEGEATASFIAARLKNENIRSTRIATGIPMGGDLKYVDQVTLKRAMETRYET
jgi:recombination protein RecR